MAKRRIVKSKKKAKYTDRNGGQIINLKSWKEKHPGEVYFDSLFEYKCYKVVTEAFGEEYVDFNPEPIHLFDAFKDITGIKDGKLQTTSIRKCQYTPDFIITCPDGYTVYVESKGYFFDASRIRYKIFQNKIIKDDPNAISVVIKYELDMKNMKTLCKIIKRDHFETNKKITTSI